MHSEPKPVNLLPIINPAVWSELQVPLESGVMSTCRIINVGGVL